MKYLPLLATLSVSLLAASAQTPPAAAPNIVTNGGFERSFATDNLWDGVDSSGYLHSPQRGINAIAESGVRNLGMPASVAVGDLNGDSLPDLMVADANGYLRVYFNSGTKEAYKFTTGEIVPSFLAPQAPDLHWYDAQKIPKINLFDWAHRGVLDIAVGNYAGQVFLLQNTGSAGQPEYKQIVNVDKTQIQTSKKGLWGNLFSPLACDLNKDGLTDLLVGEGSYSANAVHLLINKGSNATPTFDEKDRYYLVYGDGREHLTPALADFNGDGFMDVISSDRLGQVGVYLNPGASWKPGVEFKFSQNIKFGTSESLGGICSIATGDLNGDGLFDIVIGRSSGRVSVAINHGTNTAPKFDPPVDIKGEDLWARNVVIPSGWEYDAGFNRGNAYSFISTVTEKDEKDLKPPEGVASLKMGYFPSTNTHFKVPHFSFPGLDSKSMLLFHDYHDLGSYSWKLPSNMFVIRKNLPKAIVGKSYVVSISSKGNGAVDATWTYGWHGYKEIAPDKITRGERGVSVQRFFAEEEYREGGTLPTGSAWAKASKSFNIPKFKDKNLDIPDADAMIEIRVTLPNPNSTLYIDDISIVQK